MRLEPFMNLTDTGRDMAFRLGENLPENFSLRFFSSYIGRCIETAYLIDKGFVKKTGSLTENNRVVEVMSPFYVRDLKELGKSILSRDVFGLIRAWIDGYIPETVMMNAAEASRTMVKFVEGCLCESERNTLNVSVTHDWNIYLLKEFCLGLPHEDYGKIAYLEGIVFFEKNNELFAANYQTDPVRIGG
jgi:broad specificity phosphatase PhoE